MFLSKLKKVLYRAYFQTGRPLSSGFLWSFQEPPGFGIAPREGNGFARGEGTETHGH